MKRDDYAGVVLPGDDSAVWFLLTVSLTVWAVSFAVAAISSPASIVSRITPRCFNSEATPLISLALSRAANVASLTASVSSSMAPLCLIILTVSFILADSSLILIAMFLIASAVCSGVISLKLVFAVFPLEVLSVLLDI